MFDNEGRMKFPIRLVPNRSGVIVAALFALVWIAIGLSAHVKDAFLSGNYADIFKGGVFSIMMFSIVGIVGFCMLGRAILMALPSSPFFHLEISSTGLKRRRWFDETVVAWAEIGQLNVVQRMQRSGRSKRRHWWVLVEAESGAADQDVDRRIKHALLAYDANDFAPLMSSGEEAANDLREALEGLLKAAQSGETITALALPRSLREVAVAVHPAGPHGMRAPTKTVTVQTAPRRRGVIER